MALEPVLLVVPSRAAAVELPRRLASSGRAVAGLVPMLPLDLARALAEPVLLGRSFRPWNHGHAALLAGRLLDRPHGLRLGPGVPRPALAAALARTLGALRAARVTPERLEALAASAATEDDRERLRALALFHRGFAEEVEGRFADPATLVAAACEALACTPWLRGTTVILAPGLDPDPLERELLLALFRVFPVSFLSDVVPGCLAPSSFPSWAEASGVRRGSWADGVLAPLAPADPPAGLERLRRRLFEPPSGSPVRDGTVELLTAPGEPHEARAIVRRLLREAGRGVPFEEMAVLLPRPDAYAPLLADVLQRLGVPFRLHPSLPLRTGRCARSLLLLLRCRGLSRSAVMELLTFCPVPFAEMLGSEVTPRVSQWDALSREAGVVSGLERWIVGLRSFAEAEQEAAGKEGDASRQERRQRRAEDAETLLRVVELLSATLDSLDGEAGWPEWSARLLQVIDEWIGRDRDREALVEVVQDLAALGDLGTRASRAEVESVLEARLDWERTPLDPVTGGAVHMGALDALAGLSFRFVAVAGLVEGGFPGVLRPDPFLLDAEREALARPAGAAAEIRPRPAVPRQLSLFEPDEEEAPAEAPAAALTAGPAALPTTQDRLLAARRAFHAAVGQATDRLVLSYPRADARTGRERMPSLFFVAAATALAGRPVSGADLEALVGEDDPDTLPLGDALDPGERDRLRMRRNPREASLAIAAGSTFFRQSVLATHSRWLDQLTPYDGLVAFPREERERPPASDLQRWLDPAAGGWPVSASRLATYTRCGFQYLLEHVLRLEPALEPVERTRLEPLERGSLFHEVAERFLRERRDRGELPVRDTPEARERLAALADEALDALVASAPPRYELLWRRERARFHEGLRAWLAREASDRSGARPAHFEVAFGMPAAPPDGEPHSPDPLLIDLGEGRQLRVRGRIDRIDRRPDGLVLRDYKTGRAPRDEGGLFRSGRQLQVPFYVLAARQLFPGEAVVEAFLDYVDGGRRVSVDPAAVGGEAFRAFLGELVGSIADGIFLQEPTACDYCDYRVVCGPRPLLEHRRRFKARDPRVRRVLRLKDR